LARLTLVLLLASLWLARRLANRIGAPIRQLAEGTRRVAAGELDHEVRVAAVDEVQDLVEAFNRMTRDLKRSQQELVRTERIAAWQGVARRLAHEIKNPLTPIGLSIHRLRSRLTTDPTVTECLDTMLEETENLKRLADEFSLYARLPEPRPRAVETRPLLEHVVELYARRHPVEVRWDGWCEADTVWVDEGLIRQVFSNVVKNAIEAMGHAGCLTLRAARRRGKLRIEIQDDGPGLPAETERIFEPHFSTKASGTGLGLAISRKILEDHGGGIEAAPAPVTGSVFILELPLAEEADRP
jgi:nitrogen fixation/metabolism regulation signal transduction histidine kinase